MFLHAHIGAILALEKHQKCPKFTKQTQKITIRQFWRLEKLPIGDSPLYLFHVGTLFRDCILKVWILFLKSLKTSLENAVCAFLWENDLPLFTLATPLSVSRVAYHSEGNYWLERPPLVHPVKSTNFLASAI